MIAAKTLKLSVKSLQEFAKKRLPDEELIALDERDECPLEIVRHMCSPDKLGIQLLFIPEEYGGFGGGAFDVYCVCEEMARIDLGVATAVLATFLGSDPITVGATPEQKKLWLTRIAEEGVAVRLRRHRTGRRQRPRRAANHRGARDWRTAAIVGYRSTAASSGSAMAASPTPTRSWRTRPPVRAGSSWKRARRDSPRQAGEQARHPHEQHRGALVQRRLRGCRPAGRRRRRPGTASRRRRYSAIRG